MTLIDKLDFGQASAESEQEFLGRVFLPTTVFQRIRNGQKHLVLGRKGSGKTAVCMRLYEDLEQRNTKVSLVTPRDLSKFKMALLDKGSLNSAESSLLSWKYIFFVEISNYILESAEQTYGENHISWPEAIKQVRKFMAQNTGKYAGWLDKTLKIVRRIKKVGVATVEAEIDPNDPSQDVADFTDKFDEATQYILKALELLITVPIYILVDKVDELWEPDKESQSLVVGLLRASKEIHEQTHLVNVVTFLRSDIFDALQFHDSDKFHSDEERIVWDKADLKRLMALRARASTGMVVNREATDKIWLAFFPDEVEHEASFDYLLKFTLMRPRELIQLCNLCRDKAQNHRHSKITTTDIAEALPQHSKWKLKDLRDEYSVQYPFLQRVFLGSFQHTVSRLTRKNIIERVGTIKEYLLKEFDAFYFEPIDNLLQILYNIGFLGAVKDGLTLYSSVDNDVIIAYVDEFEVHPAFRSALDIRTKDSVNIKIDGNVTGSVIAAGSSIEVGGNVNVVNIYRDSEREISELLHNFDGQNVPGNLFNLTEHITLPRFKRITPDYNIPEAGIRTDFFAQGSETWLVEVKQREVKIADLHQVLAYGITARARPWIISYANIPSNVQTVAKNLNMLITGPEELRKLMRLVRL